MKRAWVLGLVIVGCGGAKPAAPVAATAAAPAAASATATAAASAAAPAYSAETDALIPIEPDDAVWGSRVAPVTIVELTDLQCPYCARAWGTLKELENEYGPDKLRIVFKHMPLPFHAHAHEAAEAATGVRALGGDAAFWKFVDSAYGAQAELGPEAYGAWARAAGVDADAIKRGVASHQWSEAVDRDVQMAGKFGLNATPTFLINGMLLDGAQPKGLFEKVIDDEAKKAADKVAQGTPADRVYAVMTDANVKAQIAAAEEAEKPDTKVYDVPVGSSPALGPKDAPVTIVEFSDFQCPFCKHAEKTIGALREQYGKRLRVVWKNEPLPFHPFARPAAELALEARAEKGDAAFWATHDALFAASPKLDDDALMAIAKGQKLDAAKVKKALESKKHDAAIAADEKLAEDLKADGTPHFFVNGRRVPGAQPIEVFQALIDEELAKKGAPAAEPKK